MKQTQRKINFYTRMEDRNKWIQRMREIVRQIQTEAEGRGGGENNIGMDTRVRRQGMQKKFSVKKVVSYQVKRQVKTRQDKINKRD